MGRSEATGIVRRRRATEDRIVMADDLANLDDDAWDITAARAKLAPKNDGSKRARKARQTKLADAVNSRSLRATGRDQHLNFKASKAIKDALDKHVPKRGKSLWLEQAIIAKLREQGIEIEG